MSSIPYERRKDYFKRYYQENKVAFLERNRKNRAKRNQREALLEEVAKKVSKDIIVEMERKMMAAMKKEVKS